METTYRSRSKRKLLQVTFPSGKTICYANVTDTMIAVLCEIGSERFQDISLEMCHLPLLSKEIYPKYREWMKPVCDGWYVNAQSNTDQKYLQLTSISDSLGLGLIIRIGEELETQENPNKGKTTRPKGKLLVKFPDGTSIINTPSDSFIQSICKIGVDDVMKRGIEYGGNDLISQFQKSNRQIQISERRWITVPNTIKDKVKILRVIALHMGIRLEIIDQ